MTHLAAEPARSRYAWAAPGDVSAFLGLAIDNIAQLITFSTLLIAVFGFPADLVLRRMLPGTALGVLFGDLVYTWLAFRLARQTGAQVTAMPLGIDTPSLFGLTFGVLGPAFKQTGDAVLAWQIGMALMVIMGVFKIAASFIAGPVARRLPLSALFGPIGGIGLLLIAFFPLLKTFSLPLVGLPALFLMLYFLLRDHRLPGGLPPVLLVVLLGTAAVYALRAAGLVPPSHEAAAGLVFSPPVPTLGFVHGLGLAARDYLPVALPLALVTVIGGIDTTASAAEAGDHYRVRDILLTEGVSTLLAGLLGGVIQTTPYIGHPAYKRMGGRAAYTLATALFVGLGGTFGYLATLVHVLPEVVVAPIMVFIGLEITAQAFRGVPSHHAPAVAVCFVPAAAYLIVTLGEQLLSGAGVSAAALRGPAAESFAALSLFAGGFVFSGMLWGAALSFFLDGRPRAAAGVLLLCAAAALFGVIHSPLPGSRLVVPWLAQGAARSLPYFLSGGYLAAAAMSFLVGLLPSRQP